MPEYRQDIITGRWVIMATERARRPETFSRYGKQAEEKKKAEEVPEYLEECPFCTGNEALTPSEVVSWRDKGQADTPGWQVRVVPNKYPAVEMRGRPEVNIRENIYPEMPGYGSHEVIIETPRHNCHPGFLSPGQMEQVVEAYLHRLKQLSANTVLKYVQVFRNHLREAGASVEHPHTQLLGLPFVPAALTRELDGSYQHYLREETCPYCLMLKEESRFGERMIFENENMAALMPYASRHPFETWVLPRRHRSSLNEISGGEKSDLAEAINQVLKLLSVGLDFPPYNMYLHTAPLRVQELPFYHWHLVILPRTTAPAGFEMGSEVFINTTVPEHAARFLREEIEVHR